MAESGTLLCSLMCRLLNCFSFPTPPLSFSVAFCWMCSRGKKSERASEQGGEGVGKQEGSCEPVWGWTQRNKFLFFSFFFFSLSLGRTAGGKHLKKKFPLLTSSEQNLLQPLWVKDTTIRFSTPRLFLLCITHCNYLKTYLKPSFKTRFQAGASTIAALLSPS